MVVLGILFIVLGAIFTWRVFCKMYNHYFLGSLPVPKKRFFPMPVLWFFASIAYLFIWLGIHFVMGTHLLEPLSVNSLVSLGGILVMPFVLQFFAKLADKLVEKISNWVFGAIFGR